MFIPILWPRLAYLLLFFFIIWNKISIGIQCHIASSGFLLFIGFIWQRFCRWSWSRKNIKLKGRWGPGHSVQRDQQRHDHHGGRQRQPQLRGQVSQSIIHNQSELKTQKIHIKIRFLEATLSRPSRGRGRTSSPSSSATRGARAAPWKVRREGDKHVKCDVVHAACRYYPSSEKSWTLSRWWQVTSDFVLEVVPGAELELISILFDYFLTRYQPQQWHAA